MKQKEKAERTQSRKNYSKRGTRSQKMLSFRADAETLEILEKEPNKGRAINEAVQAWRALKEK